MPITLTGVTGPLNGQVFEYGKSKTAITIGRNPDCDVRFPPDFRDVSRAHLTITHENDRYFVRADTAVFVDGRESMRDDALPAECELRLGTRAGPGFRIRWTVASDMPSTHATIKRPLRTSPVRAAIRETARTRRFALIGIAGVAAAAIAAVAAYFLAAPSPIATHLAAARPSVYLIVSRTAGGYEDTEATAWAIGPGLLATNAHVVESYDKRTKAGVKTYVRSSIPPYETHEVLSGVAHPQYQRFSDMVDYYAPVAPGGRLVASTLAYDVGLLRVAPSANLGQPLKVASPETLRKLAAGDEVGYVGYPSEKMAAGGVNVAKPTPQTHVARITAVTDFFLAEDDVEQRQLIQHSLPGTGGSSGSPLFNARGEVIALFNAGNTLTVPLGDGETARIPNILVNFAQRADLIVELMNAKVETVASSRDDVWRRKLAGLPSAAEYLVDHFQTLTGTKGAKPALETALTTAEVKGEKYAAARAQFEIPGPGHILFLGLGPDARSLGLFVFDESDNTKVLAKKEGVHYPYVRASPPSGQRVVVELRSGSPNRKISLRVFFAPKK